MTRYSNISLKKFNTFGIDVSAKILYSFADKNELIEVLETCLGQKPIILGGGSNILFTREVIPPILKNEILGLQVVEENESYIWVKSGAGVVWHDLVTWAVNNGYGGIENLALIPGTVGAAPMQNIGAYGVELKDTFYRLEAIQIESGESHVFHYKDVGFGYRKSIFKGTLKGQFVITSVVLKLRKHVELKLQYGSIKQELSQRKIIHPTLKDIYNVVIEIRQSKLPDPSKVGNGGSFFKNPVVKFDTLMNIQKEFPKVPYYRVNEEYVKVPAGWLIETEGWKGYRRGDIGVYPNHALVLVNWGQGTGAEIWELAQEIQESVFTKFGIRLEPEVNVL